MPRLRIDDEEELARSLRIAAGGGLTAGLAAAILVAIAGGHSLELTALSFGGVMGVAAAFGNPEEGAEPILSVIFGLAGGAFLAWGVPSTSIASCLAGAGVGLGLTTSRGISERVRGALASAAALGAGVFTTTILLENGPLPFVDVAGVREVLTASIWGTFFAASAGLRRLRAGGDPLRTRLERAVEALGEESGRYLRAARDLYTEIRAQIASADGEQVRRDAERVLERCVRALDSLARRGAELRRALEAHPQGDLEVRRTSVEARLETASGEGLRRELEAAREELARQADDRQRLETAVSRIDVRQQRCLSALQRLHVHLVEDCGASDPEQHLEDSLEKLEHLTENVQWRNLSVEEICRADEDFDALDAGHSPADLPDVPKVDDPTDGADDAVDASTENDEEPEPSDAESRAAYTLDGE